MKILKKEEYIEELKTIKVAEKQDVSDIVTGVINNIKENGDKALLEYELKFDKVNLTNLLVTDEEIEKAYNSVPKKFIKILEKSAKNIKRFHSKQVRKGFTLKTKNTTIGQKIIPIERAGLYVPGGTAAYPSTVLMNAIPAKIAGVSEICIATPPRKDGTINEVILAAAKIAGVDKIYKMGGAQAIAALAYGTETVKKVDKIVGPGNIFVAEAKRQVYGIVSIDMIAGPSEITILADGKSNPKFVAADLLSQAEHDKNARAILITDSKELANKVEKEVYNQVEKLKRKEIAKASIDNNGRIVLVASMDDGIDLANIIAPEHLEISTDDPFSLLEKVKNAGSVFLGRFSAEVLGDYYAGPNHTLPTCGTARFSSPLSVDDFIKKTQFAYYTDNAFKKCAKSIAYFANKEGLTGHAKSALVRLEETDE
ncbi:MAG: histidinol dehydrogenase [Clostridia bacterium]|nr:histidinol dehydrogenase [Clostridia bacterium]